MISIFLEADVVERGQAPVSVVLLVVYILEETTLFLVVNCNFLVFSFIALKTCVGRRSRVDSFLLNSTDYVLKSRPDFEI